MDTGWDNYLLSVSRNKSCSLDPYLLLQIGETTHKNPDFTSFVTLKPEEVISDVIADVTHSGCATERIM